MFSIHDFNEKQILFIRMDQLKNYRIKLWNDNIRVYSGKKIEYQLSLYKIFAVFIIGEMSITTKIIRKLSNFGIKVYFLKFNFDYYASISYGLDANYLIRDKQYKYFEKNFLDLSKKLVFNKVVNQLKLLKNNKNLKSINKTKKIYKEKIDLFDNLQSLLGLEGSMSKVFYSKYFNEINWYKRMPRTKIDINNYLLDIAYTFLFNFIDSILSVFGFDTYKGFYHQLYFQRKSLTCDLMEPFRSIMDKALLKIYHLNILDKDDFYIKDGAYLCHYREIKKYTKYFFNELFLYKTEIFLYMRDFYYYILSSGIKEFPAFDIRKLNNK